MSFEEFYLSQNNIKIIFNQYRDIIRQEYAEEIPASFIPKQMEIMKQRLIQFLPDKNKNIIENIKDCNSETISELKKFFDFQKSINMENIFVPPSGNPPPLPSFPKPIKTREESPTDIPDELKPISVKKKNQEKTKEVRFEDEPEEDLETKFKKLSSAYGKPTETTFTETVQPDLVKPELVNPDFVKPDFVKPNIPNFTETINSETIKIDITEFVDLFKQYLTTQKDIQESFLNNIKSIIQTKESVKEPPKEPPKITMAFNLAGNTNDCIIPLGKKINNVLSMEIIGAKIPRSQYLINYSNNTLYFSESKDFSLEIKIPIGDYTITQILENIINAMNKVGKSKYSYKIDENTSHITLISDLSCDDKIFILDMSKSGLSSILGFEEKLYDTGSTLEYTGSNRFNINPQSKIDLYFDNINPDIPFGSFYLDSDLYIYRTSHSPIKKVFGRLIKELDELHISFNYDFCGIDWEMTIEITCLI
jgi:hypothetical protein